MTLHKFLGRIMTALIGFLITQACMTKVHAKDISIFDIRKNIPLANDEPGYKDFYLNGGASAGLKRGMKVTLTRTITLKEAAEGSPAMELHIPMGSLRLIHVQERLSVGRLEKLFSREDLPMVEHQALMVGDRVNLELQEKDYAPLTPGTGPQTLENSRVAQR